MRTLVVADEEQIDFDRELRADLLISCGDLSDEFISRVAEMTLCRNLFAVKGNHDSGGPFPAPIKDLHLTVHEHKGLKFGGFNGCWRYKPNGHFLYEQEEVEKALESFPPVDVFVAHNSPHLIHQWDDGVHVGFKAFNTYIERARPQIFIHGHQHVNAETMLEATRVIGVFGQRWVRLPSIHREPTDKHARPK
ncbi:MAG TPA: metallophosphoesterase family protein [Verrucomicrobiae bacterium]|jgi:Icc-related predicted phosphoesterase|nr:metallophosphoesterase family protein [Verrucomicrobiae bacterium]